MSAIEVSVVIVNYNGADVILDCLASLDRSLDQARSEVIVVDNASTDGSPELIEQRFPPVHLIRQDQNLGFGAANNIGVRHAQGEYLLLLNSDTLLTSNLVPPLIQKLARSPRVGIVGPRLLNPDGSFQLSVGYEVSLWGEFRTLQQVKKYRHAVGRAALAARYNADQTVDWASGAAMFLRRSLFETLGGFDETFFMYFEDCDFCQRVRNLGYPILYTPEVSLIHLGGYSVAKAASRIAAEYRRSQRYYYQKHRPRWEQWGLHRYLAQKEWRQSHQP